MENHSSNETLINEAIKRILLDIVIRGHGERLIGRWSREPTIQAFLERVPYLLDRINQVHLICARSGTILEPSGQRQHLHSHHRHRETGHTRHNAEHEQDSLHELVNLIGTELHWLVRTRDSLGLTPLHKAVLFNNRPIMEFILDRYPDELAAVGGGQSDPSGRRSSAGCEQRHQRLIDAQDKYGRTALHYAAAMLSARRNRGQNSDQGTTNEAEQQYLKQLSLFKFLLAKGANRRLRDFRGKTADFYSRHADQLRVKSIIHLANKLNANYQAVVLSRTLKALTLRGRQIEGEAHMQDELSDTLESPSENRESMSISCSDLRAESSQSALSNARSRSTANLSTCRADEADQSQLLTRPHAAKDGRASEQLQLSASDNWTSSSLCSSADEASQLQDSGGDHTNELAKLRAERVERLVLDERTKMRLKKSLNEGKLEAINELVIDGLGALVLEQARLSCWNAACRRYIENVIPNLLRQLDTLHELVASNQLLALKALVTSEPILARIRRPYKRASMNALHLAAHWNRKSIVSFLIDRFPELVSQADSHGATCLHWAARSLHSDRLYAWLADHFGAQLEQVRDRRGKTAANFRQQAIRLASFECRRSAESRPKLNSSSKSRHQRRDSQSDVERILGRAQRQADELQASGARSQLMRRPGGGGGDEGAQKKRPVRSVESHRIRVEPANSTTTPPAPIELGYKRDESAQVDIGIGSGLSVGSDEEKEPESRPNPEDGLVKQRLASKRGSSADSRNTSRVARAGEAPPERADEQAPVQTSSNASSATDLFHEFGQLEAAELEGGAVHQVGMSDANGVSRPPKIALASANDEPGEDADALGTRGSGSICAGQPDDNQATDSGIRHEQSVRTHDKNLNQLIGDCMGSEQFKKLEHLILAGCGRRVQQIYKNIRASAIEGSSEPVSREMRAFLEGRAIEFTKICEQIHQQIHRCHSQLLLDSQLTNENQSSSPSDGLSQREREHASSHRAELGGKHHQHELESDNGDQLTCETLNSNFHKLSSLLQDNSFLMARDKFGASPLHVALIRSDGRLLDYLMCRQPNVASAPDHDNRTTIHYAAIVLAAFERHGPFKVTNSQARAYWQVDQMARQVYRNLCDRFGSELGALHDRKGKTGADYLSQEVGATDHIRLEKLPRGLYEPGLIAGCCPEYAQMLQRYDYLILIAGEHEPDEPLGVVSKSEQESQSEPITQAQSPIGKIQQQHSSSERSRTLRYAQSKKKGANGSTSSEPATSKSYGRGSKPLERLGSEGELVMANSRTLHSSPNSMTMLTPRQVVPGGVVGGSDANLVSNAAANPVENMRPDVLERGGSTRKGLIQLTQQQQQTQVKRIGHSPPLLAQEQPPASSLHGFKPAVPFEIGDLNGTEFASPMGDQHRRNRSKYGHHHGHHSKRSESSGRHGTRNRPGRLSVVGGVIVPTIIHNDKMDEIETYDIIYRQPPSKCNSDFSSSSTGSFSGSNTSLNSSLLSLDDLNNHHSSQSTKQLLTTRAGKLGKSPSSNSTRSPVTPIPGVSGRHKIKLRNLDGGLAANVGFSARAPLPVGVEDTEDEEEEEEKNDEDREEDDRVERLSNEFEDRVRREKSELRQKVDQIMREIKSSAKSGKSSRFLASPNDLSAINKQCAEVQPASSQDVALMDAKRQQGSLPAAFDTKSMTSSGESKRSTDGSTSFSSATCSHSQCNSSSSSSSNLQTSNPHTRTSSCSSSSSSGSTISSVSSPTTSIGGGREKRRTGKTVTIQEPRRSNQSSDVIQRVIMPSPTSAITHHLVSKNSYGQTYLHFIASKSQSSSTLYKVLEHGKHLIGERDVFYRTARDVALQFNLTTNVQVLDKYVIDLFIGGQTQLLCMLLNQGYSPLIHVSDPDGNDIMLILKLLKQERIINHLLQMADFQRWRDELHTFIRHGYSAGVSELIKKHKDLVRAKSTYSRTSLHLAVLFDRLEMFSELIAMDPSCVQAVDNMGRTPLHYVYGLHLKNSEQIRTQLIANGASLETRDVRERTPKYYYIFRREIEDIRRMELELN